MNTKIGLAVVMVIVLIFIGVFVLNRGKNGKSVEFYIEHKNERKVTTERCRLIPQTEIPDDKDCVNALHADQLIYADSRMVGFPDYKPKYPENQARQAEYDAQRQNLKPVPMSAF